MKSFSKGKISAWCLFWPITNLLYVELALWFQHSLP